MRSGCLSEGGVVVQLARTGLTQNKPPPPCALLGGRRRGRELCYSRGSNPGAGHVYSGGSGAWVWAVCGLVKGPQVRGGQVDVLM